MSKKSEITDKKNAFARKTQKQKTDEELEKSVQEKMRALEFQKYYTGGAIVLMFLVLLEACVPLVVFVGPCEKPLLIVRSLEVRMLPCN